MRVFHKSAWIAVAGLVFLGGCGSAKVRVNQFLETKAVFPKTVAILPFTIDEKVQEKELPQIIFREVFFNNFSYLGYTDMPLDEVDQRLHHGGVKAEDASKLRPMELRRILGVEAVIRGHVLDANNFTGGIHAETRINAKLEMIDLKTGEMLWEVEHTEIAYSGIATPTIVDIIQEQIENAKVKQAYYKTAETFSQKVIKQIPDPAPERLHDIQLPVIASIETNLKANRKLKIDDRIYVSMRGQPGLTASFDIGSWRTSIPMKEVSPGVYTGSYLVRKGDEVKSAFIIGTLKNKKGLAGKKYYKSAMATIGG
ncbi:MAG: GNA1162 family protein [Nitrospinaceae bacterium]